LAVIGRRRPRRWASVCEPSRASCANRLRTAEKSFSKADDNEQKFADSDGQKLPVADQRKVSPAKELKKNKIVFFITKNKYLINLGNTR